MESINTLVVLGASGDLARRLLLPGLGTYLTMSPERRVTVVGSAHEDFDGFADMLGEAFDEVEASGPAADHARTTARWQTADATSADDLAALLADVEGPACLYFALEPEITTLAVRELAKIDVPKDLALALEKPVGHDLESARELNALVGQVVDEDHVFRVDHFLGQPGVLSLVGLRHTNRMLAPLWNEQHIASIDITYEETLGLEGRADFYDDTGALRDMIQSHLLQVMAIVMMDPPSRIDDVEIQAGTAHILRNTRISRNEVNPVLRARYTEGHVGGKDLPNYADEEGVDPNRETETFAQVTLEVDSWRWSGVPVTLRTGKAIGEPTRNIRVTFRHPPHEYGSSDSLPPDVITMGFDDETVTIGLNAGGPFDSRGTSRLTLSSRLPEPALSAYGSVMRWIMEGNPTFTVRADAVEESWHITEDILKWYDAGAAPLLEYRAGSSGPSA